MILADTIIKKLDTANGSPLGFDFDIRYLSRWFKLYPQCFPKYMLAGNYQPTFNWQKMRWEIYKTR
jgi:hypothetical protein